MSILIFYLPFNSALRLMGELSIREGRGIYSHGLLTKIIVRRPIFDKDKNIIRLKSTFNDIRKGE